MHPFSNSHDWPSAEKENIHSQCEVAVLQAGVSDSYGFGHTIPLKGHNRIDSTRQKS